VLYELIHIYHHHHHHHHHHRDGSRNRCRHDHRSIYYISMGMTTGARSGPDNGHGQLVMIVTGNCHIRNTDDDIDSLQIRINKFVDWTEKWQVKLNTDKCKVISIHHRR